jgi:membrane protease YdiL (CAAX protease family)
MKPNTAISILLGFVVVVILFHIAIITKVIPYDIAWGGRLQNDSEMYVFEAISILINLFFGLILLMKGNYLKFQFGRKVVDGILWFFLFLFVLNTVGNLFAKTSFERSFSVLTLTFAALLWTILKAKNIEK